MGAEIEITGSGDGSTGNITIYRIGILNLFSHFTVSAGCSNGNTYEGTEHDGKKFESEPEAISAAQKWIRSLEGEEGPRGESHEVSVIGEYKNGNGEILHTFTTPCIRK